MPRCGRPIQRGPRAKWCSDDCRVRAWQEEHWMGKKAGHAPVLVLTAGVSQQSSCLPAAAVSKHNPQQSARPTLLDGIKGLAAE